MRDSAYIGLAIMRINRRTHRYKSPCVTYLFICFVLVSQILNISFSFTSGNNTILIRRPKSGIYTFNSLHIFRFERSKELLFALKEPGRVAQPVWHLTRKSEVLGSIPGLASYFRFSFR